MKINGIEMTPARKSTLIQISRGREICNQHTRCLRDMGVVEIHRAKPKMTPAGWEVIDAFGKLE